MGRPMLRGCVTPIIGKGYAKISNLTEPLPSLTGHNKGVGQRTASKTSATPHPTISRNTSMIFAHLLNRSRSADKVTALTFQSSYDILSKSDKTSIANRLTLLKYNVDATEIDKAAVIWDGVAIALTLQSGRTIHLTTRSFWPNSATVKTIGQIISIVQAAHIREERHLAARQAATHVALKEAIARRRQVVAVTVAA